LNLSQPLRCNRFMRRGALTVAAVATLAAAATGDARSPRNGLIAFWSGSGTPAVRVMRADGSGRRLVTRFDAPAKRGSFSPDGRWLVFDGTPSATGPREDFDIQRIRLDGTGRRRLTSGPARDTGARWSPDGRTIVFQRLVREAASIWTMRADGTGKRRLAAGSAPSFSPDGRRIVFARGGDVWTMRSDGTDMRRLRRSGADESPAGYSPDGRAILLTAFSATAHRAELWTVAADGSHARRLSHGGYDVAAAWSPDATRILFTRIVAFGRSERGTVAVMSANGTHVRVLTPGVGDEYATSWQAAG
jgi:Tol biopolymer transport system component